MTPTEDRLTDALAARAAQVRPEELRPLSDVRSARPTRARRRLAPAMAAAAAVAAIGLAVFVTQLTIRSAQPFANVGTASSPPPYYVNIENAAIVRVRSTATGKITGTIPQPDWYAGGSNAAVASSADGRVFVEAIEDLDSARTHLFRFRLTSSGQVAGLAQIPASPRGLDAISVGVSPDGSMAAVAGVPDTSASGPDWRGPPLLVIVDLRTGSYRVWHGLRRTGDTDTIRNVTWAHHGRSLRFLVVTCPDGRALPYNLTCLARRHDPPRRLNSVAREWTLRVPAGRRPLSGGRPLMTLPSTVAQAIPDSRGTTITTMNVVNFRTVIVARYAVPTGRLLHVLYRGKLSPDTLYASLSSDAGGRYPILNKELGGVFGWIGHGRLHRLRADDTRAGNAVSSTVW